MKTTTLAVTLAALLTLTACSSGNDDAEAEAPLDFPNAEAEAPLDFPNAEALNEHVAERFAGTAELIKDDLTVMIESKGFELSDKGETVKVLEDVGEGVKFDYDTLTVASNTDTGTWGYRYGRETVEEAAENDVLVDKVWNLADTGTNNAY